MRKNILQLTFFASILIILVYLSVFQMPELQMIRSWAESNYALFVITIYCLKTLGIIVPPMPGSFWTLASIPIIGWWQALIIDIMGSLSGAAVNYHIGKKYGFRLLTKFFNTTTIEKIQNIKVKPDKELEFTILMKILSGGVLGEGIQYLLGMKHIRFRSVMLGNLVGHLITGVPIFYLFEQAFTSSNRILHIGLLLLGFAIVYRLKDRYFEKSDIKL